MKIRWPWVSRRYADFLEHELEYFRLKSDAEKDRADRLLDTLMRYFGQEPVTNAGIEREEIAGAKVEKLQDDFRELFAESTEELDALLKEDVYGEPAEDAKS